MLLDWLRLIRSETIGPANFAKMLARFGSAGEALAALNRRGCRIASAAQAEAELAAAEEAGLRLLTISDPDYPRMLAEIDAAPPLLYVKGRSELLNRDCVAIVGARNASAAGRLLAGQFAGDLGRAGIVVVSGLARGIDGAAHEAALPFGTIAVVAGGCDVIYPPEHAGLSARIAEAGAILAEMPPGTEPSGRHFPRRNRIISGLSRAIVLIEAAIASGSLITARFGLDQGREIYAVPGSPLDPRSAGSNELIKSGAALATSAADVIGGLTPARIAPVPERAPARALPDEISDELRQRFMALLSPTPIATDDLVRLSGLPASTVAALVLELELSGLLLRHSGQRVSLSMEIY